MEAGKVAGDGRYLFNLWGPANLEPLAEGDEAHNAHGNEDGIHGTESVRKNAWNNRHEKIDTTGSKPEGAR
jgi:hypothetical protein